MLEVVACMESFVAGSDSERNAALAAKREASVRTNHALSPVRVYFAYPGLRPHYETVETRVPSKINTDDSTVEQPPHRVHKYVVVLLLITN